MKNFYLFLISFLFPISISAQLTVTNPVLPVDNKPVTITFDATQGNAGLKDFTGDVYAHTGVITNLSTSNSDWKYVKAGWTVNIPEAKLTRISANIYQLTLSPSIREYYAVPAGEKIQKLAFVFRSADTQKEGKTASGGDIFVDAYEEVLSVSISQPATSLSIFETAQDFPFEADAIGNDSIALFVDNVWNTSVIGQSLITSVHATGSTKHSLIARAYKGISYTADTAYYMIRSSVETASVPTGMKDGINYNDNTTATLVIYAPFKNYIFLIGDFNNWSPDNDYLMKKDVSSDRYWITLNNLTPGKEYIFQYLIDGVLHIADPYTDKTSDPNDQYIAPSIYPGMLTYPAFKTTEVASVLQTGQTPYTWKVTDFIPADKKNAVVYELLIRDFTANHDIKTITDTLSYLKRLGVNVIELMPFNEFEGNDSWGYNPSFYFAPDKAYGTKNDYKAFIDACHQNGIAVVQDLVLNHSYGESPLVRMYFENGKPSALNPWYNVTSNMLNPAAQWGYDFNHESKFTQKLIDSIASYWMSEYKIDGFRYDFTKGFTNTVYDATSWASTLDPSRIVILKRMASAVWQRNSNAFVIFEHLSDNNEETILANYGILLWGNMNYNFTQAASGYTTDSDFSWLSYKKRGWTNPFVMGYMESHDEERIMYTNLTNGNSSPAYSIKDLTTALKRMQLVSAFFYAIPGPKMIWQFGELGYDQSINLGGRTSQKPIHWEYYNDIRRKKLYDVTKAMINLKKNDPVFSTDNFSMNVTGTVKHLELLGTDEQVELIGNFDIYSNSGDITFPASGKWYELFNGDSITLTTTTYSYNLQPGDYKLFCNVKLPGFSTLHTPVPEVTENDNLKVFPNPFDETLFLNSTKKIKSASLWNTTGSLVLEKSSQTMSQLDVEGLKDGVYILTIDYTDGSRKIIKVVKAR